MTPEQQGLIEDIATRFVAAAPETEWTELQIDVSMLNSISGFAATAVNADGAETPFFIDDATDKKILHALGRLREDMAAAKPGIGAWYIMSLHVPREDKPYVDFDYFTKPTFGVHVGDGAYKQDLKAFPRSEENLPEWLGGKPRPVVSEPASAAVPEAAESKPETETTPPVASDAPDTPQVAPAADISLDDAGVPQSTTSYVNGAEDEALAAVEAVPETPPVSPAADATTEVSASAEPAEEAVAGSIEVPEAAPVTTAATPEPPIPANEVAEDDTPWYEDEAPAEAPAADDESATSDTK